MKTIVKDFRLFFTIFTDINMNKIIIALTALIAVALAAPLKGDSSILAEWEAFKVIVKLEKKNHAKSS